MTLRMIVGIDGLAVTLAEAKQHIRVDHDDDDVTIETYLKTAIEFMEARTLRMLAPCTLQYQLVEWPCTGYLLELPRAPVREVSAISYLDPAAAEQTADPASWYMERLVKGRAGVAFRNLFSAPDLLDESRARIFVTFRCGYDLPDQTGSGDDPELKLPHLARAGVLLLTAHWYENREAMSGSPLHNLAPGVDAIVNHLKLWK